MPGWVNTYGEHIILPHNDIMTGGKERGKK